MLETLWYTRCPAPTAATIAITQDWLRQEFEPDGTAVRSLASSRDRSVQQAHYSQSQPNAFRFGGTIPPLVALSRGADIKIAGLAWHDRLHAVFALPGSGIETAEDLRGKRLSLPVRLHDDIDWWQATVLEGYDQLFRQTGLSRDEVSLARVPIARSYLDDVVTADDPAKSLWGAKSQFAVQREEVAALHRGEVDAIYSDGAMAALLAASTGVKPVVVLDASDEPGSRFGTPSILTVSGSLFRDHHDIVVRLLARFLDAQQWVHGHQDAARRLFARETGVPEDFLEDAYSPRLLEQISLSLEPRHISLLRQKKDHLVSSGFLRQDFDIDAVIEPSALSEAKALRARQQGAAA